jgi:hypothetical protein
VRENSLKNYQINVDKDADCRQEGNERNFEAQLLLRGRLKTQREEAHRQEEENSGNDDQENDVARK